MAARAPLARAALPALLVGAAVLYLVDLSASGWANTYYSAAAQAGSQSWKAFLLGCSDAACGSTIDKPPLSVWPAALTVRLFGLSSWSVLVPQAVIGVLTVWAVVATVRRTTGSAGAGLLAGLVLAVTPVATLMYRFNNPDPLLTLLLVLAAAAVLRAVEPDVRHPARWVLLAGALVGLAFLAKMLQAFLVLPALGLVYLLAASAPFWRRCAHLVLGFAVTLAVAGAWVLLVASWPAASRPFIGSTADNSILELVGGYNGVDRLTGGMTGSSLDLSDEVGPLRMLNGELGGQIGWLLPTALLLLVMVLVLRRAEPRTDPVRAAAVLWGSWTLVSVAVFSAMAGVFHAYYTVSLAPAVAALVGIGAHALAGHRVLAALAVAVTAVTGWVLLERSVDFLSWLPWVVAAAGAAGVVLLLVGATRVAVLAALVAGLAGPVAYSVDTARTPHRGAVPVAGPLTEGRPDRGPPDPNADQLMGIVDTTHLAALLRADADRHRWTAAVLRSNPAGGYQLAAGEPVLAVGGFNASDPFPTLRQFQRWVRQGQVHYYVVVEPDLGAIRAWVAETYDATTLDGVQVYDLTS